MPSELRAEVVKVEPAQQSWVAKAWVLPRKVLTGAIAQVKKSYTQLKNRYGPRYTKAMLGAAFVAFFLPIPGSSLLGVALVVVIAETHRAISQSSGFPEAITDLVLVVKANLPWWATGQWPSPPR